MQLCLQLPGNMWHSLMKAPDQKGRPFRASAYSHLEQVQQKYLTLQKSLEPDKRLQTLITGSK